MLWEGTVMSTSYRDPDYERDLKTGHVATFVAEGFPPPRDPAEGDLF